MIMHSKLTMTYKPHHHHYQNILTPKLVLLRHLQLKDRDIWDIYFSMRYKWWYRLYHVNYEVWVSAVKAFVEMSDMRERSNRRSTGQKNVEWNENNGWKARDYMTS